MKTFIITVLTLFVTLTGFAQKERSEQHREKIKALKVGVITDNLDLTASEAEKFWPIYNAYEEAQERFRREEYAKRKTIDFEALSEQEAQDLLDEMAKMGKTKYDSYASFLDELKAVIPAKKILLLKKVEEEFKRNMIKEFQKRRKGMPRGERP